MKRRGLRGALALALAAAATTAIWAVGGALAAGPPGEPSDKGARLHIDAEFNSYLEFAGNERCHPPLLLVIGVGTAKGTHLSSRSTATAEECSDDQIRPGFFVVHGMGTFKTPNGDELYLDYHETSNAPDFTVDPCDCVLYDEGTFTVVGGTGRFAGATGSGSISAVVPIYFDFADPVHPLKAHVTAQYEGTIRLAP
jgi:hypothetical protein